MAPQIPLDESSPAAMVPQLLESAVWAHQVPIIRRTRLQLADVAPGANCFPDGPSDELEDFNNIYDDYKWVLCRIGVVVDVVQDSETYMFCGRSQGGGNWGVGDDPSKENGSLHALMKNSDAIVFISRSK